MNELNMNAAVGEIIRIHRERCNMTQDQLADAIGKSRPTLVNIERGAQNIHINILYTIAEALSVPISALLPSTQASDELAQIYSDFDDSVRAWKSKHLSED